MVGIIVGLCLGVSAWAGTWHAQNEAIWDVKAGKFIALQDLAAQSGDIFIFGEEHATTDTASLPETYIHHTNQLRLIQQFQSLRQSSSVSVGMEFLTYTIQNVVDQFLAGVLPEADFLKQSGWSNGNPFDFYRAQILAPAQSQGQTVALNIPQSIADQVAQGGKDSLTAEQMALTPPFWERGNDAYFARFQDAMAGHASVEDIEKFFWAQSLWDDTMAWKALQYRAEMPNDVLVVIVGEFHVQFGGGLPYELKKNGTATVKTILQVNTPDWSSNTLSQAVQPDATYGDSADYIWLHTGEVADQ